MSIHFEPNEFSDRRRRALDAIADRGLSGILIFRQESMFWLTGYDTDGYSQFQCLWLGRDGEFVLITRSADVRQARLTSIISDIRVWIDKEGANPASIIRSELGSRISPGMRIGVEYASATLNAQRGKLLDGVFSDVLLSDVSDLIVGLRVVKSPAELEYVRKAAAIADAAWPNGLAACLPGKSESDILAELYGTILRAGGDLAASRFICGAGDNALLCRYFTGKGTIRANDQVTIEYAATYRHYHVALMRTVVIGTPTERQLSMHSANVEALNACRHTLVPGNTFGDIFDTHAAVLDRHGFQTSRLNACGYSLGAAYPPTWMEWPMAYTGNPTRIEPNMVIFLHMIQMDSENNLAMSLGETFITTEVEPDRLSSLTHVLPVVQ